MNGALRRNIRALNLTVFVLIIDQTTKLLVRHFFELDQFFSLFGKYIGLRYILNPGIVLGIKIGGNIFFSVFMAFASVLVLTLLFQLKENNPWIRIALALILGGALGNLMDRLFIGKIVDFIEIGPWPIFNLADVAVTIGLIVLIVVVLFDKREDED